MSRLVPMSSHHSGVALVVVSAVVFSTAGLFAKGVSAEAWAIIYWRGLAAAGFTIAYLVMRGTMRSEIRAFGRHACLVTVFMAAGTAAFIPAFKLTSIANVALIYAAAPFLAAGLAWLWIKEAPSRKVLIASVLAIAGVGMIVSDSFGHSRLTGDLLALFMTLMMASTMVVYRAHPETTAALPAAVSSLVLLPFALALGDPFAVPSDEFPILITFGLVFAVASVTLSEGARRLPSAETALLSTLEVPLAPVLAWMLLSETVTQMVVGGGAIIVLAVIWSQTDS